MAAENMTVGSAVDAAWRAQFSMLDVLRRFQGDAMAASWLGTSECSYQITACGPHWRLRDYGGRNGLGQLLIIAAPIKQPYIWDLAPEASAIRYCLQQDLHVHLLEWRPPSRDTGNYGFDDCAQAISDCVTKVSAGAGASKPFIIGHSLGGTLAAIYGAFSPKSIRGLVLLGAPLCFWAEESRFRDALISLMPPALSDAEPFPGSLLSHMSAIASPGTFIWSRLSDAALSFTDLRARDIHMRVERWALDEVPLSGRLVHQLIDWLYRENRLCQGILKIQETEVGPFNFSAPLLAVVNTADDVAPLVSIKPFIDKMLTKNAQIIEYPGELGVCLQHLGILIGSQAHAHVWPKIISWLKSHG